MNTQVEDLEPQVVWSIFREITRIPRCSGREQRLQDWVEEWSENNGISHMKDDVGNILLSKEAYKGHEDYPVLTLQAHQDMVCEKVTGSTHNFETDPLDLQIKDGYVTARDTSLGADNGIGMALAMATLVDPETRGYGKLEVLMTVEEETTFRGAMNVRRGFFEGKKMINLDSEEAGVIIVESAGGLSTEYKFKAKPEAPGDSVGIRIEVDGLLGGHSGVDINLPRANAIKLISEGLTHLAGCSTIRICRFDGGTRGNAIPRSASCDFLVPNSESDKLTNSFSEWRREARQKYGYEEGLTMVLKDISPSESFPEQTSLNIIKLINEAPQGVIKLSDKIEGLAQTSSNIGVIKTEDETVTINIFSRSSNDDDLQTLSSELSNLGMKHGAETHQTPPTHGWSTPPSAPFVKFTAQEYREFTEAEPKITGIHGGLECSQFASLDPNIQIVSIGATIEYPHSPRERLLISSVKVLWKLLEVMIRDIKQVEEVTAAEVEVSEAEEKDVTSVAVKVPEVKVEDVPTAKSEAPKTGVTTVIDNLRTQMDGIDTRLKLIGDKTIPVDLKTIEDEMKHTREVVDEVNKNLASIDKRIQALLGWALVFSAVGVGGTIILLLIFLRGLGKL